MSWVCLTVKKLVYQSVNPWFNSGLDTGTFRILLLSNYCFHTVFDYVLIVFRCKRIYSKAPNNWSVVSAFYVKPCMFFVENLLLLPFILNPVCFM